ncbi:MAG: carbon-nitrogen hydrolase [Bacteroidetes bacterium]|nr:carbon-nitrogen hydrolase [Bacteroidota bacterium]
MINVGIIQFSPVLGNLDKTIDKLKFLFKQIKSADLIVLPELANSGYNFTSKDQAFALAEETGHSRYLDFLQSTCNSLSTYMVTGFNEREGDKIYNSAILLGRNGIIGKYRKLHLFLNEADYFTRGNLGLPVFDLGDYKIGMLICFDWIFPEVWRILALKGADIICHPSNLVLPYAQKVVPAHALVNRVFTVTANRVGTEGDITFTGKSFIADTEGIVISMTSERKEEVIFATIDPREARDKMVTIRNSVLSDRRPEEYSDLIR